MTLAPCGQARTLAAPETPPGTWWLPVTLTLVSAASMALEIVAGRALAPYVGMSLYSWTIIIAVVLAGLSAGHWIGGIAADRSARPDRWVAAGLTAATVTTGASLALLRLAEPLAARADPIGHTSVLAMAAFFVPSLLAGLMAPLLTKMALDAAPAARRGRVLGQMFALGAVGAILGTLIAGLVLISLIGTTGSVILIAALYGVLALVFWSGRVRVVAGASLAALAAAAGLTPIGQLMATSCDVESAYFCIRVDDQRFMGRTGRVMALDHLAHGINDAADPRLLLTPYVQGVDEIVRLRLGGGPDSAFFVGGGAYSLPRAWADRNPGARLVVAELDPQVTRVARERLWLDQDLEVVHADARVALGRLPADQRFDVIFGDAFHDIAVPQHLVTDEFHALIRGRLTGRGIYAMNVVDKLREPRFVLSLAQTLGRQFRSVELWLDLEAVRPGERRVTWIVIAADQATEVAELEADTGFARRWVRVPVGRMIQAVGHDRLVVLTDDHAPVDWLMRDLLLDGALVE